MITVLSVFGTRPEAIKMAPVVRALSSLPEAFRSVVCVTGQHREMLDGVLGLFGIAPDHDLDVMRPDQSLTDVATAVLRGLEPVIRAECPDWLLVQGDTTTALAGALAGFYQQVAVGHVEAGLRTWDKYQPFPEEVNRKLVSAIADRHFAPTAWAAANLRAEGIPEKQVTVTGNTVVDAIRYVAKLPFDPAGTTLERIAALADEGKRIVLVTAHRRENFGRGIAEICGAVQELAEGREDIHVVYPVHPNPRVTAAVHRRLSHTRNLTLLSPLDYREMVWLLGRAALVLTDSGGLQEEAPALGVPVLVLRETTERPEGIDAGSACLIGTHHDQIVQSTALLLDDPFEYARMAHVTSPYGTGTAAKQIVDQLQTPT